jgi:hypothetical protein
MLTKKETTYHTGLNLTFYTSKTRVPDPHTTAVVGNTVTSTMEKQLDTGY